jgi:predicted phosphodiesterase
MRLALISDIHANLEALEATFYDIAERSIDRIVCLGDIVGYNSDAAACIALIRGADCVCVAGNHDLAVCGRITTRNFSSAAARAVAWTRQQLSADDLDFLENLPLKANIGNASSPCMARCIPRPAARACDSTTTSAACRVLTR